MITGLNLDETIDYVIPEDKDNPTIWKLGIIPSYLFARISSSASTEAIETTYKVLQVSLKGWENFNIPFSIEKENIYGKDIDVVPISVLERIPIDVISKLAIKAMEINQLTEQEEKN